MSSDVSGFGTRVNIVADVTFPEGFVVTQFSNDADPLDMPPTKFADTAMGVNGDFIRWSKAVSLPMTISVIPGSDDDINLQIIADANRVAQGKISAQDTITAVVIYPDGQMVTLIGGAMTDAPFGRSISSDGRQKTRVYSFMFADKNEANLAF